MEPTTRNPSQWMWRSVWIALMVLVTSLPYLINYFYTPTGFHYTWIIPPYPQDSLGYRAWSEQAARGALLFKIKYTALPHAPFFFHPLFLLCGFVSSLLGCDVGLVLFFAKAVGVVLFFWAFFRYVDYLNLNPLQSIIATVLVGVASGFGWLALKLGVQADSIFTAPIDLNTPDSITFWSLLWNPLFPFTLALMVIAVHLVDRGARLQRIRELWWSGICVGVMALLHPFQVPVLLIVGIVIVMVRQRQSSIRSLFHFLIPAAPLVLWVLVVAILNPVSVMPNEPGRMHAPTPLRYMLGLGLPLFVTLGGLIWKPRRLALEYWPLLWWLIVSVVFTFSPLWFDLKCVLGVQLPLCILAAVICDWIVARIPKDPTRQRVVVFAAMVLLPLLVSSHIYLFAAHRGITQENKDGVYYIRDDLLDALNFLKHNSQPDDIVFATYSTSQLIPGFSGNTVVWGHWAMTVDFESRKEWVTNIFDAQSDWSPEKRRHEFWGAGIRFILADGELKQWFEDNHPTWLTDRAEKVFENKSAIIYRKRDQFAE